MLRDEVNVHTWLKSKGLLEEAPTATEKRLGIQWVKRNLKGVDLASPKKGVYVASEADLNTVYELLRQAQAVKTEESRNQTKSLSLINKIRNEVVQELIVSMPEDERPKTRDRKNALLKTQIAKDMLRARYATAGLVVKSVTESFGYESDGESGSLFGTESAGAAPGTSEAEGTGSKKSRAGSKYVKPAN